MSEPLLLFLVVLVGAGIYYLGYCHGRRRAAAECTLDTYENWHRLEQEKEKRKGRPFS